MPSSSASPSSACATACSRSTPASSRSTRWCATRRRRPAPAWTSRSPLPKGVSELAVGQAVAGRRGAEHAGARDLGRHRGAAVDAGRCCAAARAATIRAASPHDEDARMTLDQLARNHPRVVRLGHPPRPRARRRLAGAAGRRAGADLALDGAAACAMAPTIRSACWRSPRWPRCAWSMRRSTARGAAPRLARPGRRSARWRHLAAHRHRPAAGAAAAGRRPGRRARAGLPACWPSCRGAWPALPVAGPGGAGAAAAVLAAVLRRLPAARDHGRGQPLAAGAGLHGGARGQQPAGRRPAGDRRCALLRRADGLARLLHGLRRGALGAARRPRASWPGCRPSACWCWPATSCATACWSPSKARAMRSRRGCTRRWAWLLLALVCGGIAQRDGAGAPGASPTAIPA